MVFCKMFHFTIRFLYIFFAFDLRLSMGNDLKEISWQLRRPWIYLWLLLGDSNLCVTTCYMGEGFSLRYHQVNCFLVCYGCFKQNPSLMFIYCAKVNMSLRVNWAYFGICVWDFANSTHRTLRTKDLNVPWATPSSMLTWYSKLPISSQNWRSDEPGAIGCSAIYTGAWTACCTGLPYECGCDWHVPTCTNGMVKVPLPQWISRHDNCDHYHLSHIWYCDPDTRCFVNASVWFLEQCSQFIMP